MQLSSIAQTSRPVKAQDSVPEAHSRALWYRAVQTIDDIKLDLHLSILVVSLDPVTRQVRKRVKCCACHAPGHPGAAWRRPQFRR